MTKLKVNTELYEQSQPAISRQKENDYSPAQSNGVYSSAAIDHSDWVSVTLCFEHLFRNPTKFFLIRLKLFHVMASLLF